MLTETALPIPLQALENGFLENDELMSLLQTPTPNPNPVCSNSGSAEENRTPPAVDERKRRRMISNRESARRSRMRKQRHMEELRNQVSRLRTANRAIANRLAVVSHHCHLVWRDNDQLRAETVRLRQRLFDIHRTLVFRELQQMFTSNIQTPQLIA